MKKLLTLMIGAALLASCQQEENEVTPSASRVTISPIITRATEVNFEDNDRIGLTITKSDGTLHANNELMTFNNGVFAGNLNWYAEGNETSTLVAYYPYDETGAPTSFSVQTDQTSGYGKSDLMAASKSEVVPSANSISMPFRHMFTKLVINVTNETGLEISSVVLQGSIPTANLNLEALSVTADANTPAANITAQQVEANKTYRAIIIPQTVALTLAVTTSDNKILTQKLVSTTLVQSGQYSVNVRVLPDDILVTLSGEITNWTDEGSIEADNEVAFEEFENYFVYDGVTYNTVTLANGTKWMTEPLIYLPEGFTPSGDPTADSHIWYPYQLIGVGSNAINAASAEAMTDEASIKKSGYLYDMYAALGGKEITADNCYTFEGAQGICPKGWHIPTREEFLNLSGLSNKAVGETGNKVNADALFYDANYGGGNVSKFNEGGWNYILSGVRMQTNFNATGTYQLSRIYADNVSPETFERYDNQPSLTYIMSSTCYQPSANNIQFFGQMTTFNKNSYPEGRASVSYVSIKAGQQLRCVKNQAAE